MSNLGHVRKGDTVVVIAGSHKGKRGKVLRVLATKKGTRIIVEKVAMVKRHTKPSQKNPQGGIVDREGSIHISNVQLFDDKTNKGTRTKTVVSADSKVRVGVKSGTQFSTSGM
jgi:large subunit ribosomal protein L24